LVTNATVPTFGLWYDLRQKPPLGDYARLFYAECFEEIEEAERIARLYEEAPYDHFCFWARLPGLTHEQALESMRLFASEVAPRVRDAVKA
jgi:hypothetical protein